MVGTVYHILSMLNSFHPNTQFTYETEYNLKLAFLDVMLSKVTNADVCLNWNLFAPHSWRRGTLKTLTQRAYMICLTTELLDTELKYLEKIFVGKNNYTKWVIRQIFTQVKSINGSNLSPSTIETIEIPASENETVTKKHKLLFSYQGDIGIALTKS